MKRIDKMEELNQKIYKLIGRNLGADFNDFTEISWQSNTPYCLYFRYKHSRLGTGITFAEIDHTKQIINLVEDHYKGIRETNLSERIVKIKDEEITVIKLKMGEYL